MLFALGSADIGSEGEIQLNQLADALKQLTAQIPDDIDWVLQVDGHTDNLPIFTNEFSDNWELSTARALSVVRYLMEKGLTLNVWQQTDMVSSSRLIFPIRQKHGLKTGASNLN